MINYEYPTSSELKVINAEKIPNLTRERPTFQIFKTTESNTVILEWEQRDNWRGMQQLRGLDGAPSYVKMVGYKRYRATPAYYGEYMTLNEEMLTMRAAATPDGTPVNIDDLVAERQDYLNERERNVLEYIHWKAILDGAITFIGPTGAYYHDEFDRQTATFSDWSNLTTATPLLDFINLKLLGRGKSVTFGTGALYFMNTQMVSYLLRNNNPADLGGQFAYSQGGTKPVKTLPEINTMLNSFGLGTIVEYDETYETDTGVVTNWLPNDKVAIIGRRTNGDELGEYRMTRNANNEGLAPGRYEKVVDTLDREVPRRITVHRGHNGGLVIYYPSAIVCAAA